MALVINPFAIVNLSLVIPPAWIFSLDKFPFTSVFIFASSELIILILPTTAFNSVISALFINALLIFTSFAIKFCILALIAFKSDIWATSIIASSIFAVLASNIWVLIDTASTSLMLAFSINASLIIACSITALLTLFVVLPELEKLFLFLLSPFAPISEVSPPV